MISLVQKYLEKTHYSNKKTDFKELFLSHPNYPSIFAITDSLNMLSVENIAVKVSKEQLIELPDDFLAIYNQDVVLVFKTSDSIHIVTEKISRQKLTFNEFLTGWNGVVIAIEPNGIAEKENLSYDSQWLKYSLPFIILIGLSVIYNSYTTNDFLLLFTSLVGLLISVFIVQEKFGIKNEIASKFCNINPNASCDSVIKSNESNINKWVNFSDLPFLFFSISVLAIIIKPEHSSIIVGFLSLLSVPVILYSIWLQKFQLKKWCMLCLAVSFVIVSQSFIFGFSGQSFPVVFSIQFFGLLFSFVLITSIWLYVKPVLQGKITAEHSVNELKKFKRNYTVFNLLTKNIPVLNGFDKLEGLHFGNKNATVQLAIIISPSCGHCHKAFQDAFELVSKFPEHVFVNVLFNINPENSENPYKIVVDTLLFLNYSDSKKAVDAISDWHIKKMELTEWKKKWAVENVDMKVNNQIHLQYNWCLENEFNYTPVKIINDKLFPGEYEISELKYFLNDFSNEKEEKENTILEEA